MTANLHVYLALCEEPRPSRGRRPDPARRPGAYLAAPAIPRGYRLATADRGSARDQGVTSFDPVQHAGG